jgi:hypothetical protein
MKCTACGTRHIRPSKLQFTDFPHFFTLKYPVRCLSCGEREYRWWLAVVRLNAVRARG